MEKISRAVRIESYFPWVLQNAREMQAIAAAENPEFNALYEKVWAWFANTFIFSTDLQGVERWERMLGLFPAEDATLYDRRAAIFMAVNGTTPYTEKSFERLTDGMYHKGAVRIRVFPNSYAAILDLADDMTERANDVFRYARLIIPANITLQLSNTVPIAMSHHIGAVVRRRCKGEIGRLRGDVVSHYAVTYTVGREIFEPYKSENLRITFNGIKPTPVMVRGGNLVKQNPTAQIGDEDEFFIVAEDGMIRLK